MKKNWNQEMYGAGKWFGKNLSFPFYTWNKNWFYWKWFLRG